MKSWQVQYAYERFAARPTLDIDFLGVNVSNEEAKIVSVFREICSVPFDEDGVLYEVDKIIAESITEFKDYHGIRLKIPVRMDTIFRMLDVMEFCQLYMYSK